MADRILITRMRRGEAYRLEVQGYYLLDLNGEEVVADNKVAVPITPSVLLSEPRTRALFSQIDLDALDDGSLAFDPFMETLPSDTDLTGRDSAAKISDLSARLVRRMRGRRKELLRKWREEFALTGRVFEVPSRER